jgi:alpha,alpha-trehalose phosphorylase
MGFAGMRVDGNTLCFDPVEIPGLPDYRFTVTFRGAQVDIAVSGRTATVSVRGDHAVAIRVAGDELAA